MSSVTETTVFMLPERISRSVSIIQVFSFISQCLSILKDLMCHRLLSDLLFFYISSQTFQSVMMVLMLFTSFVYLLL